MSRVMNPMASSLLDDDQLSPTSPDSGAFAAAPAPATTLEVSRPLPSLRRCISQCLLFVMPAP